MFFGRVSAYPNIFRVGYGSDPIRISSIPVDTIPISTQPDRTIVLGLNVYGPH